MICINSEIKQLCFLEEKQTDEAIKMNKSMKRLIDENSVTAIIKITTVIMIEC